jgi:hypothetical protein
MAIHFVQPYVVPASSIPLGQTGRQYVADAEVHGLPREVLRGWPSGDDFGENCPLVLVGESGCGKSTYLMTYGHACMKALQEWRRTLLSRVASKEPPHVPVFIPLRNHKANELRTLLQAIVGAPTSLGLAKDQGAPAGVDGWVGRGSRKLRWRPHRRYL